MGKEFLAKGALYIQRRVREHRRHRRILKPVKPNPSDVKDSRLHRSPEIKQPRVLRLQDNKTTARSRPPSATVSSLRHRVRYMRTLSQPEQPTRTRTRHNPTKKSPATATALHVQTLQPLIARYRHYPGLTLRSATPIHKHIGFHLSTSPLLLSLHKRPYRAFAQ